MAPSFRLWRSSVTVEELTATVARYLGEERTRSVVRELRRQPRASASSRKDEADFQLVRYAEHHAGLGDRRGVLAARAVAAAAQAHGLDQGRAQAARRRQRRDPVQPRNPADRARPRAPGHRGVRQGPAADLLEPAVRRNPRPAAEPDPRRHRARRDPALQRRARRARARARRRARARAASSATSPAASRSSSASPSAAWSIEVRANRMPDGGIVTTFTDITPSVEAAEALERANETLERRVRERTAELTRLNAALGARQGARPTTPTSPRPASSPPPATTSCSRSTRRGSTSPA